MDEKSKEDRSREREQDSKRIVRGFNFWFVVIILALLSSLLIVNMLSTSRSEISYDAFKNYVQGLDHEGRQLYGVNNVELDTAIEYVTIEGRTVKGRFINPPDAPPTLQGGKIEPAKEGEKLNQDFIVTLPSTDSAQYSEALQLIDEAGIKSFHNTEQNYSGLYSLLFFAFAIGLLLFIFFSMRRAQNQMMGGGGFLSNFAKSTAKKYEGGDQPVRFSDVAGLEGTKKDLSEIVEFLKDPTKFQKLGGRVPKGVLLVGPPGTGKTLLARAVAGEAEVPFFSVNGSEFIQMFVGVGASRVRDLFQTAKTNSPSIIFVDEIDAVGRQRGAGLGGGHDEREQTLNQILGEMDGFHESDSVIVVAATNRPDILDPALLRPGRFDRHITVARPTQKGRLEIFKVHVRDVPLDKNVDLDAMASATAGMTGADIQNLVNEAALYAARHDKNKVEMEDFYYAHDKVLMGARREEILSGKEKERTAFHEAGHTLAAWNLKGAHPVHKVTVIPRGQALGVTQMIPEEDRMNMSENELRDQLIVLLAGRAAEKLVYDEFTVGAENDLERATNIARRMVTHWGMSEKMGPVSYKLADDDPFLGREMNRSSRNFSEHTMEMIDEEVGKILTSASQQSINLLNDHRAHLDCIAHELVRTEELDQKQITELIGPSVHVDQDKGPLETELTGSESSNGSATDDSKSKGVDATSAEAYPGDNDESEYVPDMD